MNLDQKFFLMQKEMFFIEMTLHSINDCMNDKKNDVLLKHYKNQYV
jgi:hypothetical protein